MPLIKGKSDKAFKENVKTEYKEGKPLKQSLAIAYSMKKKSKKMAEGGQIKDNYQSPDADHFQFTGKSEDPQAEYSKSKLPGRKHVAMAMMEDERDLNQHGEHEEGRQGNEGHYAEGGEAMEGDPKDPVKDNRLEPHTCEGQMCTHKCHNEEHEEDEVGEFAEGGQITDNYQTEAHDRDMVGKIMKQRQQMYSKGGRVANEAKSNRGTDYLATDDDLEQSYTGANSGDELSSPGEQSRRKDMVSQLMKSRKKKASMDGMSGYGRSDKAAK